METLQPRVQVLEIFVLSKAWYIAHLLPLATSPAFPGQTAPATRLRRLVADFLWAGSFQRLAFCECHAKRSAGGLGLSSPQTRAQAMLAKQTCCHLAAGGRPALHLAYWLGISLQGLLPALTSAGRRLEGDSPAQYADLLTILREVFTLSCVDTANLQLATSAAIHKELTCTFPTPRGDLPWHHIWLRLQGPSLEAVEADLHFSLLHGLLDVLAKQQAPLGGGPLTCLPDLQASGSLGDHPPFLHQLFQDLAAWHLLLFRTTITLGVALTDEVLLYLAWPPSAARTDAAVMLAVTTFTAWAWATRSSPEARGGPLFSIL